MKPTRPEGSPPGGAPLAKHRLLVATGNPGKAAELRELLKALPIQVLTLGDLGDLWQQETLGGLPLIGGSRLAIQEQVAKRYQQLEQLMEETADSFLGNATLKARGARNFTGLPTLADDSGLAVACLQGAPGVHSARYAGKHGDDQANNALLLANLKNLPLEQRQACFVASMVLATPQGQEYATEGLCPGRIGLKAQGENGFGYDPLFVLEGENRTTAQLSLEEKNRISHRAQALKAMLPILKEYFNKSDK